MQYLLTFLEGIITFISPCLLPMLPIYISYFAGADKDRGKKRVLSNALGFVLGFTLVFILLGAFAGTAGMLIHQYRKQVNLITGIIIIVFGLSFMNIITIPSFTSGKLLSVAKVKHNFWSSVLFGVVFSIGWTPCVGAFLGSALMLAAQSGAMLKGLVMLLFFSLGLAVPFVVSAVLIERLKHTFDYLKRHHRIISIASGVFLIVIGLLTAFGGMDVFLSKISL